MRIDELNIENGQLIVWATRYVDRPITEAKIRIVPAQQVFIERGEGKFAPPMNWQEFTIAATNIFKSPQAKLSKNKKFVTWNSSSLTEHCFTPFWEHNPYLIVDNGWMRGERDFGFMAYTGDSEDVRTAFVPPGAWLRDGYYDFADDGFIADDHTANLVKSLGSIEQIRIKSQGDRIVVTSHSQYEDERYVMGWFQENLKP